MDYYSDSDEDVSQLNRALQESPKGNRKELNAKHVSYNPIISFKHNDFCLILHALFQFDGTWY